MVNQINSNNAKMSIGRFCGLIQADGHISFGLEKDKTIRPYIILTHTCKDRQLLENIQHWLQTVHGIPSSIEGSNRPGGSLNLKVDRQTNCKKLIDLILNEENQKNTFLFFDGKRKDFLLVKTALDLRQKQQKNTCLTGLEKGEIALKLAHIFKELRSNKSDIGLGPRKISDDELKRRLTCPDKEITNQAASLISKVEAQVQKEGAEVLEKVIQNPSTINEALGEVIIGDLDGDGSFSISLLTHLEQKNCVPFEIVPNINVTDKKNEGTYLFSIISAAFGQDSLTEPQKQGEGAMRLVLKKKESLLKYAFDFFEKHPPMLFKNIHRLKVLKYVLEQLKLIKGDRIKICL